jgi:hypothetical protein
MTDLHAPQHVGSEQLQQMQKQHRSKTEAEPSKVKKKSELASTQTLRESKKYTAKVSRRSCGNACA